MITIYIDGACEPINPGGHIGYGIVVHNGERVTYRRSWYEPMSPTNTNNIAEYKALIEALNYVKSENIDKFTVKGDSKLVINQMKGLYGVNNGAYVPYALRAKQILTELNVYASFEWIPREQNELADEASKEELAANGIKPKKR